MSTGTTGTSDSDQILSDYAEQNRVFTKQESDALITAILLRFPDQDLISPTLPSGSVWIVESAATLTAALPSSTSAFLYVSDVNTLWHCVNVSDDQGAATNRYLRGRYVK
jgi:hypothetical protein